MNPIMKIEPIDLLSLLLLTVFLSGIKFVSKSETGNNHYLSIEKGNALRGLCAIVVLFHHLAKKTGMGLLFSYFIYVGYLAVAVFFFLSGYGLQKSYICTENYAHHFLNKRLPKIIFPYIAVTLLYWITDSLTGNHYSLKFIFAAIAHGEPIVLYSWYIICICYFYVTFWILMRICKRKYSLMIIGAYFSYIIYTVSCRRLGFGMWWYNTSHLLVFGMLWATYEHKFVRVVTTYYRIITPISMIGFFIAFIATIRAYSGYAALVLPMCSAVLFVVSIILFMMKIQIGNRLLRFLGNISLEIYLIHGLFMSVLRSESIYISNDFLWAVMVITGSISFAAVLHKFFVPLQKVICSCRCIYKQ